MSRCLKCKIPAGLGGRPNPERRRGLLLACAILSISATGGTVYGWPSMRLILLREDSLQLCSAAPGGAPSPPVAAPPPMETTVSGSAPDEDCPERELAFSLIYTVGAWMNQGGRLPAGVMLDRVGPRATATCSAVIVSLGALIFGLASTSVGGLLCGYSLLGLGGAGIQLSVQVTGALYPKNRSLAMSSMSGAYQLATGILVVFAAIHRPAAGSPAGAPPRLSLGWLMAIYAMLCFALAVLSLCVWPDRPFGAPPRPPLTSKPAEEADSESVVPEADPEAEVAVAVVAPRLPLRARSFRGQASSPEFWLLTLWFSVNALQCQFTAGTAGLQLELKGDTDRALTSYFGTTLAMAFLFAPVCGLAIDRVGFGT